MLSHCANPQCSKPFLRLREGKLFLVEAGSTRLNEGESQTLVHGRQRGGPRLERYWLCDECAAVWTLVCDRRQGILLMQLARPVSGVPGREEASCGAA